jgi:hypothetical protein
MLSFVHSGAFILGPAFAGVLFLWGSTEMALFVNVGTFLLSAGLTLFLPNQIRSVAHESSSLSWRTVIKDWHAVWTFSKVALPFVVVYMVFQVVMLLTAALDSTEVAFAKEVLHLTDAAYGSLVSVAGIGFLIGAVCTNLVVKFMSAKQLMCSGTILVSTGCHLQFINELFGGQLRMLYPLLFPCAGKHRIHDLYSRKHTY